MPSQVVEAVVEDIDIEEISSSMPSDVAEFTKSLIRAGLRKFKIEKDVAQHVRRALWLWLPVYVPVGDAGVADCVFCTSK